MTRVLMVIVIAIVMGVPAGGVIGSHTALADAGGSRVVNQTTCFPGNQGILICITLNGELNTTMTASGNVSTEFNGTENITLSYRGTVFLTEVVAVHYHSLFQNGTLQEQGTHTTFTFTGVFGVCTGSLDFHLANGSVQYNNFVLTC